MSEFDDALQALDDAIYLFTKPGGGHTDTGRRLIAAKAEFKACRQALVTATLEQSGAIFQVQKLQAELLNHRHGAGDAEDAALWIRAWRNRFIDEKTYCLQVGASMYYEQARAEAEDSANQFETAFAGELQKRREAARAGERG